MPSVRPVFARDIDGKFRAYYRVKDENIVAPAIMVRAWQRKQADDGCIVLAVGCRNGFVALS